MDVNIESLIHALCMAAWDAGAESGTVWCPDADMSKRGVVPMTQDEGFAHAREHFARHGGGAESSAFGLALAALRAELEIDRDSFRSRLSTLQAERDRAVDERNAYRCGERDRATEADSIRAELARIKAAPVVGGVPKLTDEESARMKAVALSCGRHDANGELLCGSCKHSWREVNLEDCDEGCSVGRVDLFFHGEPWQDCPDFASRLRTVQPGEVPELI